jgi:hypothetical protein
VREARAHETGERRVVARTATNDYGDVARRSRADASHSALDPPNEASMCRDEASGRLFRKI